MIQACPTTSELLQTPISLIINEVCDAIKAEFAAEVIQCPTTTEEWTAIAEQFEKRWQFPHCCGATDGKHVAVTCPWNIGSEYRKLTQTTSFSGLMLALMVPATMPVSTMGQNGMFTMRG
ncbi:hypothetical protein CesoFtcFv8_016425 [Champsocephalus esox]|uniref:DDE Tnp4 domain-containing protein n=1 Tax=Champsocephalus esox TaxID=159716 RepID=A0AAN8BNC3_9TELE|nr:hypothetical protein CesoFtcFv8_016425 [Champsocephalus esox]